ncbi:MAG: hypothetical protein ACE5IM_05125 [Nitrospinota bacterium]
MPCTSGALALIGQNLSIFVAENLGSGRRWPRLLLRPVFGVVQSLALTLDWLFGRRGHSLHHIAVLERPRTESSPSSF